MENAKSSKKSKTYFLLIQSTSSILEASSDSPSSGGISESSTTAVSVSSSSSIPRPSLIILCILLACTAGSSKVKPELKREVSNKSRTRSFTDLSFLSASALWRRFSMMLWSGLISRCFFGGHVSHCGGVSKCLSLHDSLHISCPAILRSNDAARRRNQPVTNNHFLYLLVENILHDLAEGFKFGFVRLHFLLFLLILGKLEALLGDTDQVLAVELLKLLDNILINRLGHVDTFQTTLLQCFYEGRGSNNFFTLSGNVVDVLLVLFHPGDVISQGAHFISTCG